MANRIIGDKRGRRIKVKYKEKCILSLTFKNEELIWVLIVLSPRCRPTK